MPSHKSVHGCLQASHDVRIRCEGGPCDECQDLCYHVEVWAHDIAGTGEKACLLYVAHRTSKADALKLLRGWISKWYVVLDEDERKAWILEHQPSLW